jgi:hypothetical protein
MKSTLVEPNGPSSFDREHGAQVGTERFMLTLCQLAAAVSIRPPRAPQLKPYTFFMSRTYQPDGGERLYLHMGYFKTLAEAERWAETVRRHYPSAFAHLAPAVFLQAAVPEAPSLASGAFHRVAAQSSDPAPVQGESLSDTAVMKILETRRGSQVDDGLDERSFDQIELLRPEDTGVREALKEAVVQGASVSFAVQLQWSTQPIDPGSVRPLAIFKLHTLYSTQTRRKGYDRYFLRLGFFADPMSAKQVAVQVLSTFASAAVVPVVEPEITRAREATSEGSAIPSLWEPPVDAEADPRGTPWSSTHASVVDDAPRGASAGAGTDARLRKPLAARERRIEPDLLSESGVRHLKVEVQEQLSGRCRILHLEGTLMDGDQSTA